MRDMALLSADTAVHRPAAARGHRRSKRPPLLSETLLLTIFAFLLLNETLILRFVACFGV